MTLAINIPVATSTAVSTVNDAIKAAQEIGYPVILRSAFSLGGLGSGFAQNDSEMRDLAAKSLSLSPQVLIEKSLKGWKEVEYEMVRDSVDVSAFRSQAAILRRSLVSLTLLECPRYLQHGELRPPWNAHW